MFASIVVGTDGSDRDLEVVRAAVRCATLSGGTVHIAHGFRPITSVAAGLADGAPGAASVDFEALDEAVEAENRHAIGAATAVAADAGVATTEHSVAGDAADVLVELAEQVSADLIVIGNHGLHSRKRFLQGSVANRVVHHARCSVLVVDVEDHA